MPKVNINSWELNNYLSEHGMTKKELSQVMGRSDGFVSQVALRGTMSVNSYAAMCKTLGVPYGTFIAQPPAPPAYRLNLVYNESKVLIQLMRGDEVVNGAWAIIKDQSHRGFLQAISYAAHMMYKFAEQDDLSKEESA